MSSLRFAFVTTFYPPHNFGGDGIAVQRLARALARRGHRVTVIYDADAYDLLAPAAAPPAEPEPEGVEVVALRSRLGGLSPILTHQLGRPIVHRRRLAELLDRGDFDVVNFHNISLVGGPGILSCGGSALKVYLAHEHWLVCPTHVLWRDDREPCPGKRCFRCTLRHRRPPQLYRYTGLLERRLHEVDVFVALSEFSRAKHEEFGFPRPMEVLPAFLPELPEDTMVEGGAPPHPRPYLLFAGRLERLKGLDDVLPAFADPQSPIDLLVAGDGRHGPTLRSLAGAGERVRFLGQLTGMELARYYRHALAVLSPSLGFETFGLTLIEAFRQGTPVLARRGGPAVEILSQAGAGFLFDTPPELVAAAERLLTEEGLRDRLAAAARAAFSERWSEAAVLPRYLDLIDRTAERKGVVLGRGSDA